MNLESLVEQRNHSLALVEGIHAPESLTRTRQLVIQLAARSYGHEYGRDHPPEYIMHQGQVATGTGELLIDTSVETQRRGQFLAWTHDIGRAVDMGPNHPIAGARMLRALGFDESVVTFALAHHRWGLGEKSFANGNYPGKAQKALEKTTPAAATRSKAGVLISRSP